jgi:hypothetical protein
MNRLKAWGRRLSIAIVPMTWSALAWAQQQQQPGGGGDVTTTTTTTTEVWYTNWWVWAVGIAVFLIVVIALTNRGGRRA